MSKRINANAMKSRKLRNKKLHGAVASMASPRLKNLRRGAANQERKRKRVGFADTKLASNKRRKTKFEELLQLEREDSRALEDKIAERRLSKKLKAKSGVLPVTGDGFDEFLDGLGFTEDTDKDGSMGDEQILPGSQGVSDDSDSTLDGLDNEDGDDDSEDLDEQSDSEEELLSADSDEGNQQDDAKSSDLSKRDRIGDDKVAASAYNNVDTAEKGEVDASKQQTASGKYVPPRLRENQGGEGSSQDVMTKRRLRGLLNRLTDSTVEQITKETALLFQAHGRRNVGTMVTEEILCACKAGPRSNDLYAAVFASYLAGTAALVGMDFGANFCAALAGTLMEQLDEDDSLGTRNLALLVSNLYTFQLLCSETVYELLLQLCARFREIDVATVVVILQTCGLGLRADDAVAMRDFVVAVQQRAAEVRSQEEKQQQQQQGKGKGASSESQGAPAMSKRVQFMLDTICDIKNNRKRAKESPQSHGRLKKWLQKLNVDNVTLRGLTWATLLSPEKKGQWWLPGGGSNAAQNSSPLDHSGDAATTARQLDVGAAEAERLLALAAAQRMNTDVRRSIFCVVMSGDDYLDAFEKILRLKLPGKLDREVMRVIAECCMQERAFNPYYAMLAARLCRHHKSHRFSLQYCLWDLLRQIPEAEVRRVANLARFIAWVVGKGGLSLSVLKTVEFHRPNSFTAREVFHFRVLFESLLVDFKKEIVWAVFSKVAGVASLATLRQGISMFLQSYVRAHCVSSLHEKVGKGKENEQERLELLVQRCKYVKKALANTAGVGVNIDTRDL